MAKKKYTLYLPVPLARKLDQVARDRHGGKSALVEDAVRASLEPQPHAGNGQQNGHDNQGDRFPLHRRRRRGHRGPRPDMAAGAQSDAPDDASPAGE